MNPQDYLNSAIEKIEANAYYQPVVTHWERLKQEAVDQSRSAATCADTYPALRKLIEALGDRHSHFLPPQLASDASRSPQGERIPSGERMGDWGMISLPTAAGDDNAMIRYAEAGQQVIREMRDAAGWIIDLRDNGGGNMWAMLVAIGAIVGEGTLGYFIDRAQHRAAWGYQNGASIYDGEAVYSVDSPVSTLPDTIPTAILTSEQTASSGEITLISLLGRENIRTFGQPTRGIPTANEVYPLDDDALLVLTVALCADRHDRVYEGAILPDEVCDEPLKQAQEWLRMVRL